MTLTLVISFLFFIALAALVAQKPEPKTIRIKREEERDASSDLSQ